MIGYTLTLIVIFLFLWAKWLVQRYRYWSDRSVKSLPTTPILGNYGKFLFGYNNEAETVAKIYDAFPNEKVVGAYIGLKPVLIVKDPDLIKKVMIKDFGVFIDRQSEKGDHEIFENHLFAIEGTKWKLLRKKLSPIFTSGKIKNMMPLIGKCVEHYLDHIEKELKTTDSFEIRSLAAKYTLQVIGSCAFGLEFDVFEDKQNLFMEMGNEIFTLSPYDKIVEMLDFYIPATKILKKLNLLGKRKRLNDFFMSLVSKIINEREGKPKIRKDFMDLLIELKEEGHIQNDENELELSPEIIAAQAFVFYAAGFETSSATMSFLIHELAFDKDIQERAYQEVFEVFAKNDGVIKYESLAELKYLNMCFDETLRKYPIISILNRQATTNYKIEESGLVIEKGTRILIPTFSIQNDPKYYENPQEFNPERFSPENKSNRHPCTYIPFGDGPRNCIGMRFAIVQSIMAMAHVILKYKFVPTEKTPRQLGYNPKAPTLTSDCGIWVKMTRR